MGSGKKLLDIPKQKGNLTDPSMHCNAIIKVKDFSLFGEGQYWVKVFVNDEESLRIPFRVIKVVRRFVSQEDEAASKTEKRRKDKPIRGKGQAELGDEAYLIHKVLG